LKWRPLGAASSNDVADRRHTDGELPKARWNARVNASCDE
jgi:hypothetical protein